jgi:hypothetical protein
MLPATHTVRFGMHRVQQPTGRTLQHTQSSDRTLCIETHDVVGVLEVQGCATHYDWRVTTSVVIANAADHHKRML